jgi:hypothetical protein
VRLHLLHTGVHQGRLADPGLAGHEQHVPLAVPRLFQACLHLRHFGGAPYQDRGRRSGRKALPQGVSWRRRRCLQRLDRSDKPIPPRMDRLDVAGVLRIIAQGAAQGANTDGQHALTHRGLGPHRLDQRRFGDDLAGLADQTPQHGEGLGREFHHLGVAPQLAAGPVEPIGPKLHEGLCGHLASLPCRG